MNIDYFRAIQGSIGSPSKTETQRRKAVQDIRSDYESSLDVDTFILWDKELTDVRMRLNVYNQKHSTVIGQEQEFTCLIENTVQTGDIVYNPKQRKYWLVVYVASKDYLYNCGKMWRCNGFLKWQDDTGNIWEYPIHDTNSTQYNTGLEEGRTITYETAQHKLLTTSDENTINLPIDKRFLHGKRQVEIPEAWKLTQNDTSSLDYDKGIVALTMFKSQFDPNTDSKELWLCDVKQYPDPDEPITIKYSGAPKIRCGGTFKSFYVDTTTTIASWELVGDAWVTNNITLVVNPSDNNKCKVKCALNPSLIGDTFILQCTSSNGTVGQIELSIVGGM